jgi:LCP family protein required for cell wall assembly
VPAFVVLLIVLFEARQGLMVLVARFIDPSFALWALILVLLLGVWRAVAVTHAFASGDRGRQNRRRERVALIALLAAVVGMHGIGAVYAWSAYNMDSQIFSPVTEGVQPGETDAAGSPLPNSTIEPAITPPPGDTRVSILLTGVDSYVGRSERLNDTMMVVTIDTKTDKVAMVSVPRDTAGFPYYWGGNAPATMKLNSLVTYVTNGYVHSPDEPMTTLVKEVGYLIGIPVNYYATLDLASFMTLIDKVGGVDINNPSIINDTVYDWLDGSTPGFYLSAGPHHLNGRLALAYVRSRHGDNNNDWARESRQQEVLIALEHRIASPGNAFSLPGIMQLAGSMIRTNYPASQVADMVALVAGVPSGNISQVVLGPPFSLANAAPSSGTWTSCLELDKVAAKSIELFGKDSRYYGTTQAPTCAAPAQVTVTPGSIVVKTTPKPSATPVPSGSLKPSATTKTSGAASATPSGKESASPTPGESPSATPSASPPPTASPDPPAAPL